MPLDLRNAPTGLMRGLGYGANYRYAHDDYATSGASGDLPPSEPLEAYLPENLTDRAYFEPGNQCEEARLRPWIAARRLRRP